MTDWETERKEIIKIFNRIWRF